MQLQAGYILEGLPSLFAGSQRQYVEALIKSLSCFDLQTNSNLQRNNKDPFAVVVYNIVSRGLPTLAPTFIEEIISTTFLKTKKQIDKRGVFSYPFVNDELKDEIFRALHIVDPRIRIEDLQKIYSFEDDAEADLKQKFLFQIIPNYVGEYMLQLVDKDRTFESILRNYSHKSYYEAKRKNVLNLSLDFVIEVPYAEEEQFKGLAIEIEKKLIEGPEILALDEKSWMLSQIGWGEILYLKQSDFYSNKVDYTPLVNFSYNQYFEQIRKNYERPLYDNAYGMDALQIALSPFEVARIQRVILEYILAGELDLKAPMWKIAVIERDIPGAFLAIQDLSMKFNNLYHLAGVKRKFPQIDLEVYYDAEFENAALNILYQGNKFPIEEFNTQTEYDLVIDSSILRYKGLDINPIETKANNWALVRSQRYINSKRTFLSAEPIKYQSIFPQKDITKEEVRRIEQIRESFFYFIKNIFRRQHLENEQLKLLSAVLSGNNALADFPFIYEKTLLYQIVALLNPGFTLVVEPMVTSLLNQQDKLKEFRIDAVSSIFGNYYDIYDAMHNKELFSSLSALFVFITGEVFHINEFRTLLKLFGKNGGAFRLIVVDQAQSVSPWSHSFNFAYYTLGENIKRFLPPVNERVVLALSSGIDYDALEDVKEVFNIKQENVFSQTLELSNISLNILPFGDKKVVSEEKLNIQETEKQKTDFLLQNRLLEKNTLVFTHFPSLHYDNLYNKVKNNLYLFDDHPITEVSTLCIGKSINSYKEFQNFVNSENSILLGNRNVNIGVDKPNIRRLNIISYPFGTIEMLYLLQRIGRDQQQAEVNIILSTLRVFYEQKKYVISSQDLTPVKQSKEVNYEEYIADKIFSSYNSNLKKDFLLVDEILKDIKFTYDTPKSLIIKRLYQVFGVKISLEAQPELEPTSLYVYDSDDILGVINLFEKTIENQANARKRNLAEKILAFIFNEIHTIVSRPEDFFIVMDEPIEQPHENILSKLVNMSEGDSASIIIDFTNDLYQDFLALIGSETVSRIDFEKMFLEPIDYQGFIQYVSTYVNRKFIKKNKEKLEEFFYRLRTFLDTYRLLYYLIVVGLVEDYLIDYRNQYFVIKLRKLSDDQYLNRIYKRISLFVTKDKALQVFQKVPGFKGDSFVQKAINYWIFFEYNYIIQRKYDDISNLSGLLEFLKNNGDTERCKEIITNYLRAKYLFDFEGLKLIVSKDWIKIIDYFIKKIGIFKSNLKHLYQTTEILLSKNNKDYIALLMRGWAGLLLNEYNNNEIAAALDDMALALNIWRQQNDVSAEDFIERIDALLITLEDYNFELKTKIEKLFHLKIFTSWLKEFNKQFIDLT